MDDPAHRESGITGATKCNQEDAMFPTDEQKANLTALHAQLPDYARADLTEYGMPGVWQKVGDQWAPDPGPHVRTRPR